MLPFVFILLALSLVCTPPSTTATPQNINPDDERTSDNDVTNGETESMLATDPKPSIFPQHLDISSLQNMPLVILHPRTPINLQMLPGQNLASLHKSLNPNKILELLQAAAFNVPTKAPEDNREERSRTFAGTQPLPSYSHLESQSLRSQPGHPHGRSLLSNPSNSGWFQRFRGSFSNMLPSIWPFKENPFNFGLPSMNMPVFSPYQQHMQPGVSPFMLGSHQQPQFVPWRNFHGMPSMMQGGDLSTAASYAHPTRMLFGNPALNAFRPAQPFPGAMSASGSAFYPQRFMPMGYPYFTRPVSPLQRHKPLFNNVDGLHAASMEMSNAFADFTDSKEYGPEVTQKFGSVGHSINSFLKMMGLGATDSFSMEDAGGFGGGSHMAAMDSTPIARSMDFYPGYGNQAHLDEMEDFPIFHEDITEDFMRKVNLTAHKDEKTNVPKEKDDVKKETVSPAKQKLAATEKDKTPSKDPADPKSASLKPGDKAAPEKENQDTKPTEQPVASYKVPPTFATVAPKDRKQPVAIYQHFSPAISNDSFKPSAYVPAQAMPQPEAEANPNKLVDDDEVRQWRSVHSGQGYVEKRPVPNVDVVGAAMPPESLRVLQKVLGGGVQGKSR